MATKTYTLPDESFVIEKGQKIVIPMYHIHNDPKYYPDPMRFDPERFSIEQKSQRLNGTYFPFGVGPRVCIGNNILLLCTRTLISFYHIMTFIFRSIMHINYFIYLQFLPLLSLIFYIGKRFAESEMKLLLSNVLLKFEVLPCEQTEIPVNIRSDAGFISPKNPIILKFRPIIKH